MLPGWPISSSLVHRTKSIYSVDSTLSPMPFCAHRTGESHSFFVPFLLIFLISCISTAPLPLAAHPALDSSHLSHLLTRQTCAVLILLQGLPHALGPLWGAGSPHPLYPSSLPYLWAQCVPGSSQQASPPLLAAGNRILRYLTL